MDEQTHGDPPPTAADDPLAATQALSPPAAEARIFHHYEVELRADGLSLFELGRGAMGVTYKARDVNLEAPVALKVIKARLSDAPQAHERFRREARAAAQLRHPNVASVFHFGETPQGQCFYAMEFIEGETLAERVARTGPLPAALVVELALQIAAALVAADEQGLVHRDLKPANLMLLGGAKSSSSGGQPGMRQSGSSRRLQVKVIDFGLAKLLTAAPDEVSLTQGAFLGTPQFASPEQVDGSEVDARSDIFSLGATLWYALTGQPPFAGRSLSEIHDRQKHRPLPLGQLTEVRVPDALATLLKSMLAADPAKRPASPAALEEALEKCREEIGGSRGAAPPEPLATRQPRGRKRLVATLALLFVILAAGAAYYFNSRRAAMTGAPIPEKSIAVLPLANSTGDPANEYFSDGMSEEFISSLSRLPDLKVIGRTSAFQFKGQNVDSRTIGEKLGVYYLLEGSVRKSADRVRIAVELVKVADGASVWADTYDRDMKDIFAVQSEIAGAVAKQLKVALLGQAAETTQLATAATPSNQNVEAYNALLQGNFYAAHQTADDFRKALGYYEKAIQIDPRYALAHARLSIIASNLFYNFGNLTTQEGQETVAKAREAADTALRLDPNLSEAHLAKGTFLRIVELNYAAAEGECRRALELAPKSSGALLNLALLEGFTGHFDEAITLTQRQIALDPLGIGMHLNFAAYLAAVGRYDDAEAALRRAISLQPSASQIYMNLARLQIQRGQPGAALESAKKESDPFFRIYALALSYFANGDHAQADAQLKKLIDEGADDGGSQIASLYALRKEPDKVFEWLEHAWLTHDPGVGEIILDPFLRAYKNDLRFIAFAQKVGVMPKGGLKPGVN